MVLLHLWLRFFLVLFLLAMILYPVQYLVLCNLVLHGIRLFLSLMLLQLTVRIRKLFLFDMLYMAGPVVSFVDECLDGIPLTFW